MKKVIYWIVMYLLNGRGLSHFLLFFLFHPRWLSCKWQTVEARPRLRFKWPVWWSSWSWPFCLHGCHMQPLPWLWSLIQTSISTQWLAQYPHTWPRAALSLTPSFIFSWTDRWVKKSKSQLAIWIYRSHFWRYIDTEV